MQQSSRFPNLEPSQLFFPQTRPPRQSESSLQSPSPSPQGDSSVQHSFIPPSHTSVQQLSVSSKKPPLQLFLPHLRPLSQKLSPLQWPSKYFVRLGLIKQTTTRSTFVKTARQQRITTTFSAALSWLLSKLWMCVKPKCENCKFVWTS